MNIKTMALAVALATTTFACAQAATKEIINGNFNKGLTGWSTTGQVKTAESYFQDAAFLGNGKKMLGTLSQSFSLLSDSVVKLGFWFETSKPLTVLLTSTSGFSWSKQLAAGQEFQEFSKKLQLTSGSYTLSFLSNGAIVDSVKANAVQAVPGPEAGAGLGALALGGAALLVKRRRKDERAAA